ncbi:vitamin K-dependent protein Z [Rhinophrynus dorsalis]
MANVMKATCLIFLMLLLLHQAEQKVFLSAENANTVIQRSKRANYFLIEELLKGNLERECLEELCSYEEARESFEDTEKTKQFWNTYYGGRQCSSNPCMNKGVCKDTIRSYTCNCSSGYNGRNCEFAMNECHPNMKDGCQHFCHPRYGYDSYSCSCAKGYELGEDEKSCHPTETIWSSGSEAKHKIFRLVKQYVHMRYSEETGENNIALLKLQERIVYHNHSLPICIPQKDFAEEVLLPYRTGIVSGWKVSSEESTGLAPFQSSAVYVNKEKCEDGLNVTQTNRMFCGLLNETVDSVLAEGVHFAVEYNGAWFLTGIMGSWSPTLMNQDVLSFTKLSRYIMWLKQSSS